MSGENVLDPYSGYCCGFIIIVLKHFLGWCRLIPDYSFKGKTVKTLIYAHSWKCLKE